jgi:hypothetical protein
MIAMSRRRSGSNAVIGLPVIPKGIVSVVGPKMCEFLSRPKLKFEV